MCWKNNFRNLSISKENYFGLLVEWAREMGCSQDHQLIANCLNFVDSEAHVSLDNLSPSLFYYLPTFYHFLVGKLKMAQGPEPIEPLNQSTSISKHLSDEKHKFSEYASPMMDQDSVEKGSQIITSNIWQVMLGMISLSSKDTQIYSAFTNSFLY